MKFKVPGMSCGHCKASIEKAIAGLDSSARTDVDLDGKTVEVQTDRDEAQVAQAIRAAGFEAQAI